MKLTKLLAVGLAVLLVGAGAAAAVPSQANDHAQNAEDHAASADDHAEAADAANQTEGNESDDEYERAHNESERERERAGPPADAGPPTDMPAQVPDHVVAIHERINAFLSGELDDLGSAISDIVGGDQSGNAESAPA